MLPLVHHSLMLLANGPPGGATAIASLQKHFGSVTADYLELVRNSTELELQHAGGQYLRIWGPSGCIEMDQGYGIRRLIPGAVPIGDDRGGRVIFNHHGKQGYGLYHVGFGDLDADDAIWIAPTLSDLLSGGVGIEAF